jgi:HD-GYP domain-containing protein (c-di-GMP phosphodiesterase class II)
MLVCGALAFFSHDIGIRGEDLRKITVGTFLHDAGKALIPLTVLDKPGSCVHRQTLLLRVLQGFVR